MLAVPTKIAPFLQSRLFSWPGKLRMGLDLVIPGKDGQATSRSPASCAAASARSPSSAWASRCSPGFTPATPSGSRSSRRSRASATSRRSTAASCAGCGRRRGRSARLARSPPRPSTRCAAGCASWSTRSCCASTGRLARARGCRSARGPRPRRLPARMDRQATLAAERVIVAAPGPRIAPALQGAARRPPRRSRRSRSRRPRPCCSATGARTSPTRSTATAWSCPRTEGLRTTALSFVSTKFPYRAPDGHVLLRGFLGGVRDGDVLRLTDEEMVDTVTREMTDAPRPARPRR